ncbi:Cytoglobin-1 [Toxocara canis]|uniref:Cytoglobin-1 n=2 Tax=Toxocara canis TaxID=6265 RepID=A0A0B2W4Y3_TOXCA|nr:Cytoglobin-1 [Toxocara canis]VDM40006.1 unnamed protein product [Toxocara canis]
MYRLEYCENIRPNLMDRLSAKRRQIIKETFEVLDEDAARVGLTIYARLLCKHPDYKSLWPQFIAVQDSSLVWSNELKMYGIVFMNAMRFIVDNIDNTAALEERIQKIARSHKKYGVHKTHVKNMVTELLAVLSDRLKKNDQEVNEAWTVFLDVIGELLDEFCGHNDK